MSFHQKPLPAGTVIADYEVVSVLGAGGFGITYKALETNLDRHVAIKEYLPEQFAGRDDTFRVRALNEEVNDTFSWGLDRFKDEARTLALFRHPNIVSVLRFIEANGTGYLAMEFEEGDDLETYLRNLDGRIGEETLVALMLPVLDGLDKIHAKGILHRDIKPENVIIRSDGTPVLIDFGSARPDDPAGGRNLTSLVSPGYSPPEQYGGAEVQGPWSDLYSFGGTLYRVIAGEVPCDAQKRLFGTAMTQAVIVGSGHYSPGLLEAVDRCLAIDMASRPQSVASFLEIMKSGDAAAVPEATDTVDRQAPTRLVPSGQITAPLSKTERGEPEDSGRSRWPMAAVGVVAVAALAVGLLYYGDFFEEPTPAPVEPEVIPPDPAPDVAQPAQDDPAAADDPVDTTAVQQSTMDPPEIVAPAPTETPPGDAILAEFDLAPRTLENRAMHIGFTISDYLDARTRWDECRTDGCDAIDSLEQQMFQVREAPWNDGSISGEVRIVSANRTSSDSCPWRVIIEESMADGGQTRLQQRVYCTSNGLDGSLESQGEVSIDYSL